MSATLDIDLLVDWNEDGDLLASGDNVRTRVRANVAVTATRGRDQLRSLAPPMAGALDAELDNTSRDYSAENGASPLAGLLEPGRDVRLRGYTGTRRTYNEAGLGYNAVIPYNGSTAQYDLWRGDLDDLPQHPERDRRTVSLPALGILARLRGIRVSTALHPSIDTGAAMGYLLDAAGIPAARRSIGTGQTILTWWWLQDADAFDSAIALLNTEGPGAALYEDGQGRVVFEGRHYRLTTARCTTSQATFRDTGGEPEFSAFVYESGAKDVINLCELDVTTRTAQALAVVWSLGTTVSLGPNQTLTYVARHTSSDPFTGALFVAGTDYTVSTGSLATASLSRTSGASATITLTAGSGGATVGGVQLRAQLVTVTSTTRVTASTGNADRSYGLTTRAEISLAQAQDLADAIVQFRGSPRPTVTIQLNNGHADRLTQLLTREMSDRVTIVEAQTGVNAEFFLERKGLAVASGGKFVSGELGAEKADATVNVFILGTHQLGSGKVVWY